MPDGDKIHPHLRRSYQLPYLQLCEWVISPDEQGRTVLNRMRKELNETFPQIAPLLRLAAAQISDLPRDPLFRTAIDWEAETQRLRQTMRGLVGSRDGIGLAFQACLGLMNQVEQGSLPHGSSAMQMLCEGYINRVYKARFGDQVLTVNDHFDHIAPSILDERLRNLETAMAKSIKAFSMQMAQTSDGEVLHLRQLPRRNEKILDFNAPIDAVLH